MGLEHVRRTPAPAPTPGVYPSGTDLDQETPDGDPGAVTCRHCGTGRRLTGRNTRVGQRILVCDTCDPDPTQPRPGHSCPGCDAYEPNPAMERCVHCRTPFLPAAS